MPGALPRSVAADIAASFQRAVAEVLADRAAHAMAMMRARAPSARLLVVAGGVAANGAVRAALREVAEAARICAGGAAGAAVHRQRGDGGLGGIERLRLGLTDGLDFAPRPRWPLDAMMRMQPMNYRHAFHAGNFADCMKHALLVLAAARAAAQAGADVRAGHACRRRALRPGQRSRRAHRRVADRHRQAARRPAASAGGLRRSGPRLGLYPGSPTIIARPAAARGPAGLLRTSPRRRCACAPASRMTRRSPCIIAMPGRRWARCCRRGIGAALC